MKRFLSIILALAMITTLIPSAFATGEAEIEGGSRTYTFTSKAVFSITRPTGWAVNGTTANNVTAYNFSGSNHGWKYIDINDAAPTASSTYVYQLHPSDLRIFASKTYTLEDGIQLALALEKPSATAGFYKATVISGTAAPSPNAGIQFYLGKWDSVKNSVGNYMTNNTKVAETIKLATANTEYALNGIVYNNGTNDFVFVTDTEGANNVYLKDIRLDEISPGSVSLTVDKEAFGIGETATASVAAAWTENNETVTQSVLNDFVTYTSSNDEIATVSADGTITGVATGTATITAKIGENKYTKDITVKNFSGVKVEYSFKFGTGKEESDITYANTNGKIVFHSRTTTDAMAIENDYTRLNTRDGKYVAFKIRVPASGTYKASLNLASPHASSSKGSAIVDVYLLSGKTALSSSVLTEEKRILSQVGATAETAYSNTTGVDLDAGEYYLVFKRSGTRGSGNNVHFTWLKDFTLDGGNTKTPLIYADISLGEDALEVGKTTALTLNNAYLSNGTTDNETTDITYTSTKETVATIVNGTVTAIGEGTAKIQAKSGNYLLGEVDVTVTAPVVVPEESEITDKNVSVYIVSEDETKGTVTTNLENAIDEVEIGTAVEATATPAEGYTFAYWKNGAGTVLSSSAKESFTLNTNTAIYAVFEAIASENETQVPVYFYNGNGEPIVTKNATKGETTFGALKAGVTATLTGYAFKHWSDKDENVAIADELVINALTRAVAIFEDTGLTYTVKNGDKVITSSAKYGEEVTVTSDATDFSYWKLGNKIMSYDKAYKFNVYGNITLTEVTGETVTAAPTIVLDNIGGNYFLTYDANGNTLIEAGILFGLENGGKPNVGSYNAKAIAKRGTGQFTAKPSEEDEPVARGYMMFKDSTGAIKVIYAD